MTRKEAIIKYITEINIDMLDLLLDDNKTYMNVPKETFIKGLDNKFNSLKTQEIYEFSKVLKGYCGGCDNSDNSGCGGYVFITKDNQFLALIFEEENDEIKDISSCSNFVHDGLIAINRKIDLFFKEDEKSNYIPLGKHTILQKQIETVIAEFDQFKNNVTAIEDFCEWCNEVGKLYESVNGFERLTLSFTEPLFELICNNRDIQELISTHPLSKKAMKEYKDLDSANENELIKWVLKYEENNPPYGDYEKVKNWEQNNLILHALDNSVVIDCSNYAESLQFSEIQPKHYWELFEKYKMTGEEFDTEKKKNKDLQFVLKTFLKFRSMDKFIDSKIIP
jgi:hypothetical protein